WLLCLVAWLPEDAEVELDTADPSAWHARFAVPAQAPDGPALFDARDIEWLAADSGWRFERQPQIWSLHRNAAPGNEPA
ncbi:hypothetical protein SB763_35825, partial [Burkholderia sp. SIMBA_042]